MAGDWIPVRDRLRDEPEVHAIAQSTGRSAHEVMGLLVDFWGWVSRVSETGRIAYASLRTLSGHVGADEEFWAAVAASGWLIVDEKNGATGAGITMPGFNNWLSHGAKRRLKEAKRQQFRRARTHAYAKRGQRAHSVRKTSARSVTTGQDSTGQMMKKRTNDGSKDDSSSREAAE